MTLILNQLLNDPASTAPVATVHTFSYPGLREALKWFQLENFLPFPPCFLEGLGTDSVAATGCAVLRDKEDMHCWKAKVE